jgi:hypothetical protein
MNLKVSILLNVVFMCILACSFGSPKPRIVRDEKDKLYRACEDSDVQGVSLGRFCSRRCVKKDDKKNCTEWKVTEKNFCEADGFNFVKNGSFVLIPEQYL